MTKQDKKIRVSFGGGFKIKNDNQRNLYPKERLSEFLNVDPNNEIDVRNYCSKYKLKIDSSSPTTIIRRCLSYLSNLFLAIKLNILFFYL